MNILISIHKNVLDFFSLSPSIEFLPTGRGLIGNFANDIAVEARLNFYGS